MRTIPWYKALPLLLPLTLAACTTTKTVLQPVQTPCPSVVISPNLLQPLTFPARDQLTQQLAPDSPSATSTKPPIKP